MRCLHKQHGHSLIKWFHPIRAITLRWGINFLMVGKISMSLVDGNTIQKISQECELLGEMDLSLKVLLKNKLQPFCDSLEFVFFRVHKLLEWQKCSRLFTDIFEVYFFKFVCTRIQMIWQSFMSIINEQSQWKRCFIRTDTLFLKQPKKTSNHTTVGSCH